MMPNIHIQFLVIYNKCEINISSYIEWSVTSQSLLISHILQGKINLYIVVIHIQTCFIRRKTLFSSFYIDTIRYSRNVFFRYLHVFHSSDLVTIKVDNV